MFEFNIHFANVGKLEKLSWVAMYCAFIMHFCLHGEDIIRLHPIHTETVIFTINDFTEIRSVGCDGILLEFIKDSLYLIQLALLALPLSYVSFLLLGNMFS